MHVAIDAHKIDVFDQWCLPIRLLWIKCHGNTMCGTMMRRS